MTSPVATRTPVRIDVDSRAGTYPVIIAPGISARAGRLLRDNGRAGACVLVSNATVWRFHGDRFRGLSAEEPILLPDGERFKNLQSVSRVYEGLIRARADRGSTLVAIGGGVLGDTAGFAAATYLRGIALVHVPTTLLAQVDSAIGGKVGVNHAAGKNLIGAFHPPALVVVDPELLGTLPRREFRAGLYETIKYGVIASRSLFDTLSASLSAIFARDTGALMQVIGESCRIKARVVGDDEHETGARRTLNFGHTVGHALEAVTKYRRLRHGEAVAYGMLAAASIGEHRGTMPAADREALVSLITAMGPLPAIGDLSAAQVIDSIGRDKKVLNGRLHFVLPTAIGSCDVVADVTTDEIERALDGLGVAR
ncbi:MAG TPA: 3-dehydroquinate synthase [Vicinamibacterales bacterium]|jgi:3-dehydroquinate synthase|nr:3-dehydroquinate synthase [Vicinamibacterales bacterium]